MSDIRKAVVLGGSGLIGSRVVKLMRSNGIEVVAASRRNGVDVLTGDGLDAALIGADVVVDASDVHSFDAETLRQFFVASGANVARAERAAGVKHHVTLSIVGVDQIVGNPYYAAKLLQEESARHSGVPFTIARSTQFYEFFPTLIGGFTKGSNVSLPDTMFQPLPADDTARALGEIALKSARNKSVFIAGSQRDTLVGWVNKVLRLTNDPKVACVGQGVTWFGATLEKNSIVPSTVDYSGTTTVEEWFAMPEAKASLVGDRYAEAVATMSK